MLKRILGISVSKSIFDRISYISSSGSVGYIQVFYFIFFLLIYSTEFYLNLIWRKISELNLQFPI